MFTVASQWQEEVLKFKSSTTHLKKKKGSCEVMDVLT